MGLVVAGSKRLHLIKCQVKSLPNNSEWKYVMERRMWPLTTTKTGKNIIKRISPSLAKQTTTIISEIRFVKVYKIRGNNITRGNARGEQNTHDKQNTKYHFLLLYVLRCQTLRQKQQDKLIISGIKVYTIQQC